MTVVQLTRFGLQAEIVEGKMSKKYGASMQGLKHQLVFCNESKPAANSRWWRTEQKYYDFRATLSRSTVLDEIRYLTIIHTSHTTG